MGQHFVKGQTVEITLHDGHTGRTVGTERGTVASVNPFGVPLIEFADATFCMVEPSNVEVVGDECLMTDGSHGPAVAGEDLCGACVAQRNGAAS